MGLCLLSGDYLLGMFGANVVGSKDLLDLVVLVVGLVHEGATRAVEDGHTT